MAQADPGPSVDVVAGKRAASSLLVDEVSLGGERVDPPPHEVRRHRVVHEEVGHSDPVTILGGMHVYLVAQNLKQELRINALKQNMIQISQGIMPYLFIDQHPSDKVISSLVVEIVSEELSDLKMRKTIYRRRIKFIARYVYT